MLFGKKKEKEQRSVLEEEQMQSPFRTIIKNLLENKLAMGGLIVFVSIFAMCFIPSDLVSPGFKLSGSNTEKYRTGIFIPSVPSDLKETMPK